MQTIDNEMLQRLTAEAEAVAGQAYAPYSKFRVGATLLLDNGELVTGANVENGSYGLTICAERSAVVRAVAMYGPKIRIVGCAVTNLNDAASPPCGACLQVLSEFMEPAGPMILRGKAGYDHFTFEELFPHRFQLVP
jgi:cytidine deaminase